MTQVKFLSTLKTKVTLLLLIEFRILIIFQCLSFLRCCFSEQPDALCFFFS